MSGGGKKINGQNWKKLAAIGKKAVGNRDKRCLVGAAHGHWSVPHLRAVGSAVGMEPGQGPWW